MVRVVAAYVGTASSSLDLDYYRTQHTAAAKRLLEPHGLAEIRVLGDFEPPANDGPRLFAVSEMVFTSREAFDAAIQAEGAALFADLQNFTNIEPLIQLSGRLDTF